LGPIGARRRGRRDHGPAVMSARRRPSGNKLSRDLVLQSRASEIGHDRLRYGHGGHARKKGVRILGADRLRERPFRRGRQLCKALDGNLGQFCVTYTAEGGLQFTPYDPKFEKAMEVARRGMKIYRNALSELAK
jgi:hypothetical protein